MYSFVTVCGQLTVCLVVLLVTLVAFYSYFSVYKVRPISDLFRPLDLIHPVDILDVFQAVLRLLEVKKLFGYLMS
jgi:hypothetical protein